MVCLLSLLPARLEVVVFDGHAAAAPVHETLLGVTNGGRLGDHVIIREERREAM